MAGGDWAMGSLMNRELEGRFGRIEAAGENNERVVPIACVVPLPKMGMGG
jgi:hypothetical protein